jgi:hypothetical protein
MKWDVSIACLLVFWWVKKCHKNASPSYGTASDGLIIWTCPCVSVNMGPILCYQRPCTTTRTEIPLTQKECSNISPLTHYLQCSVYLKSCNMSISHSWHVHPFKTYGTQIACMRMHFSRLASFHSKKFNHNALLLYGQFHHLGHHVQTAL